MQTWKVVFEGHDYGNVRSDTRDMALYLAYFGFDATVGRRWIEAGRPIIVGGRTITDRDITDRDMDTDKAQVMGEQLSFAETLQ